MTGPRARGASAAGAGAGAGAGLLLALLALPALPAAQAGEPATPATPEARALGYLAREVPRWARENRCYSCHNNGDAARALYAALGRPDAPGTLPGALADTTGWLARPEGWDRDGGDGPFRDARLARIQFAAALASATAAGALRDRSPLARAARRLVEDQAADGSWPIDGGDDAVGSPAGYGRPLATLMARDALRAADPARYREPLARAGRWLTHRPLVTTLDASVALLAADPAADPARRRALARLRAGQTSDGGWGPFADAPPEPFDTALALLALARLDPTPSTRAAVRRGRAWLASTQRADGSWPETTRPAGAESYAQRLSTTAWATLALFATAPENPPRAGL